MKYTKNFFLWMVIFAALGLLLVPEIQNALAQSVTENEAAPIETIIKQETKSTSQTNLKESSAEVLASNSKDNSDTKVENSTENNALANVADVSTVAPYHATAYCLNGRTASGTSVRRGIIAADPRVLPLGTRVRLSAGAWSGTYTVADTGGRIKGKKIDVWVPSLSEARRFGSRKVKLAVLRSK